MNNHRYQVRVLRPAERDYFQILDKYLVFYIVKDSIVEVHRIIHGARDYLKILRGY